MIVGSCAKNSTPQRSLRVDVRERRDDPHRINDAPLLHRVDETVLSASTAFSMP